MAGLTPAAKLQSGSPFASRMVEDEQAHTHRISSDHFAALKASLIPLSQTGKRWLKRCIYAVLVIMSLIWLNMSMRTVGEPAAAGTGRFDNGMDTQASSQGDTPLPVADYIELAQLAKLDTSLLPSDVLQTSEEPGRRLIFVGDIHGCYDELMTLLAKASYNKATDHIIAAGDMVNKGPNSAAVVDFLIAQGASCVRGNHDDHILRRAALARAAPEESLNSPDPKVQLAASLSEAQLRYLQSCPLVLDVGDVPLHGRFLVVHAGLVPSVSLADQDPSAVMNMRIMHPATHVPSKEHQLADYMPWAEVWNQEQVRHLDITAAAAPHGRKQILDVHVGTTIVYGHDARSGLQIRKYTRGLDTGCVRGRQLTALVLSNSPDEAMFQVQCPSYA